MDDTWYSYDPICGFETHDTADEARKEAEAALDRQREESPDGWHEDVESIAWGRLDEHASACQTSCVETPEGDFDYQSDYELRPTPDPRRDAVAEVERLRDELADMTKDRDRLAGALEASMIDARMKWEWSESLRAERDVALAHNRAAALDEVDRLRNELADMTAERDAAVADLERTVSETPGARMARVLDTALERDRLRAALSAMTAERDAALARVRELEAPPVVPSPYEVIELDGRWRLYEHQCSETDPLARLGQDGTGVCAEDDMGDASVAPDAVRGLIYAIETGKRPPHEKREEYVSSEKLTADECVYARGDKSSGWCVTEDGRGYVRHDWYERAVRSRPRPEGGERG